MRRGLLGERGRAVFEAAGWGYGADGADADGVAGGDAGDSAMKVRRPLLLPLTSLYAAALALKRRLFTWGWLKRSS